MVTMVSLTAGRESTLTVLMRQLGRGARALSRSRRAVLSGLRMLARIVLTLGALTAFTVAAFAWTFIAGVLTIGVSLLVLEWMIKDAPKQRDR